ncbi:MAG: NIPSNAP family protein [Candidatus Rokuibacteriota bacterium]
MIHEMRTCTLRTGAVAEFEDRFAKRKPLREKISKLGGFWHTESGPLNQVVHVWVYKDSNERTRIREESRKGGQWPPQSGVRPLRQENKLLIPAAFSPLQ